MCSMVTGFLNSEPVCFDSDGGMQFLRLFGV